MSQILERPPIKPEQDGHQGASKPPVAPQLNDHRGVVKPPVVPQRKPMFPNWGITAIATLVLISLLLIGIVLSQTLGPKPSSSTMTAATTSSASTMPAMDNTPATGTTPATGPAMTHQLYNPQAPPRCRAVPSM
jgi:hypothetical protein